MQGISRAWLGRVNAKTDPSQIEAAAQQILQGISLLEELGLRSHYAWGYLWLGEVYAESRRHDEAMFREMGVDYFLGKTQEVLARL